MDVDAAFVKSKRGILKVAELVTLFVAFVCFTVGPRTEHITATVLEFLITSLLLLLYLLKLNKRLTFLFWPLVDVFNSVFAAIYFTVLSLIAVSTYGSTGTLVGGVFGLVVAGILCVDSYNLSKNITLNESRSETKNEDNKQSHPATLTSP